MSIAAIPELVTELAAGRMVILVDEEDRENEGDLVLAAEHVTAEAINFMARFGRGLICLTLTRERCERLQLPAMASRNGTRHGTAFTVSIEAASGVTTGISAADRARTVQAAVARDAKVADLVQPGHIFPLQAQDGGVLMRAGHTEAGCDLAAMAGLTSAAVICEVMNDDGTMARLPDLITFAQKHNLKLGTIADLIGHRRLTERLVRQVEQGTFKHAVGGDWRAIVYANTVEYQEHLVLVKGDIADGDPVMVRMHAVDLLDDMTAQPHWINIHNTMHMIAQEGRGVVVMIREHRRTALAERVRLLSSTPRPQRALRDYGIGAQILLDLGVKNMILLTNRRRTVIGLDGYGLNIVEQRVIPNLVGSPIVGGGHEV